jgi:hypothetical protein
MWPYGGTGHFAVSSDIMIAGAATASYSVAAYFTNQNHREARTPLPSIGPCVIDSEYVDPAIVDVGGAGEYKRPMGGQLSVHTTGLDVTLSPSPDNTYPSKAGTAPAWAPGTLLTLSWSGDPVASSDPRFPNIAGGTSQPFGAPPYAALLASSAFAKKTAQLSSAMDLTLAWQTDWTPAADNRVVVDLRTGPHVSSAPPSGTFVRVLCTFDAGANKGTVPADAILSLGTGAGTYSVTTRHDFEGPLHQNIADAWDMGYSVFTHVRAQDGLAAGNVKVE